MQEPWVIRRWGVALAIVYFAALAAASLMGPPGPVYWDSFDYLRQAITGQVGGLALGRPVFVLVSHAITELARHAGLSVWHTEPALRIVWMIVASSASPATALLMRRCGAPASAAFVAGWFVALSPAMAHTTANVLTDGPALAVSVWALVTALGAIQAESASWRRQSAVAGVIAGLAFGLREQSIVVGISLLWLVVLAPGERRWSIASWMAVSFAATAALPVAWLILADPGYWPTVTAWMAMMRQTPGGRPPTPSWFALWLLSLGPVGVWFAGRAWIGGALWSSPVSGRSAAVCVPAAAQLVTLFFYPYLAYSPRYLLPVLPGVVALPAALWWQRRMAGRHSLTWLLAALTLPLVLAAPVLRAREAPLRRAIATLTSDLGALREPSSIVTGQLCPATRFVQVQIAADGNPMPDWNVVCPGWAWPADLRARLNGELASGRTLVLDLRPEVWLGAEQQAALEEVRRYAQAVSRERPEAPIRIWSTR